MTTTTLPLYQIDAFTSAVFGGNPAAVVPLKAWLPGGQMQSIAAENNLAETAFFVPKDGEYHLRWFTPAQEVPLCGHATLASAFVIFTEIDPSQSIAVFQTLSGPLSVTRSAPAGPTPGGQSCRSTLPAGPAPRRRSAGRRTGRSC